METEPYGLFRLVSLSSSQLSSEQARSIPKNSAFPIDFSMNNAFSLLVSVLEVSLSQEIYENRPNQRHKCDYLREPGESGPSST